MNPNLQQYLREREAEFDAIAPERRQSLAPLVDFLQARLHDHAPIALLFVCTHNSRRSQIAQAAAIAAAVEVGLPDLSAYSGGTEATAFFPRAVEALRGAGFLIEAIGDGPNPRYNLRLENEGRGFEFYSKQFAAPPNPQRGFAAVMVCSEADAACPYVPGAAARISLPYEDPKLFDETAQADAKYAERCADIFREILWAFRQAKKL